MNGTGPSVVATAASNYFDPDLLFLISEIGSYVDCTFDEARARMA